MNVGGAETFLMKVFRRLDKTKYSMDFAVAEENEGAYDAEIIKLGGKIHKITPKSKSLIKNFKEVKKLVKNEGYEYVFRTSQRSLSALELLAAKMGGAKVRVYRSSNSSNGAIGKKGAILHKLCSFMPNRYANVRIAPSTEAAEFVFGKNCIKSGKAHLLNNGIDTNVYNYNAEKVTEIRKEFGISDKLVIVHVGRFEDQKNHKFLIDIFSEIAKLRDDAVLLLVGKGELENAIRQQIATLGLADKVIFTGVRSDVPAIFSASDLFIMPSFFEGMPNTVIEAQATGLPCVISDTITREANITGLVNYLPLTDSAEKWAEKALTFVSSERKDTLQDFIDNKYTIDEVTNEFIRLIFSYPNQGELK